MISQAKDLVAKIISVELQVPPEQIRPLLETPKIYDHGHLALPLFNFAKSRGVAPAALAIELAGKLSGASQDCSSIKPMSGFLNFTFTREALVRWLMGALRSSRPLGANKILSGKKVIVEFSSPNVAKPMHIGHFRATVIGQCIRHLAEAHGAEVIGINHIGDWGTQFGKLAWAYLEWGKEYDFQTQPIDSLLKMYVRFHGEAEKDPELEKKGAETFRRLEEGDPQIREIWKFITESSFVEYNKLYSILGTKHDLVLGESFYSDQLESVIAKLESKNLLQESEGARVVFFPEAEKMAPCLVMKSDGASLYATRDLAAAIYRHDVQKADQVLYIVGADQSLHFKQVFRVLEMMGCSWVKDYHHITFGQYRFKDGKMSTRKGKMILFEDVIYQAMDIIRDMIDKKNPELPEKEKVIQQVAAGAVIFNDLVNDRVKNVDFDWDRIVNTEGDSGPYVQYTVVRCRSLMRKFGKKIEFMESPELGTAEEERLVFSLLQYEHVIEAAYRQFRPNIVAQYLLDVCGHFSHFYHKNRILGEDAKVEHSRMILVRATERVLTEGLGVLNIEAPEAM